MMALIRKILISMLVMSLAACGSGGGGGGASSANTYMNDVTMSDEVVLDQPFDRNVSNYSASVANNVTSFTLTPSLEDPNSKITINGLAVEPGRVSPAVPLNIGENIITMVITAPDGSTQRTYTFVVTRDAGVNANLAGLFLSSGSLDQSFNTNVMDYTASVANAVASISVTPTAEVSSSVILVNGIPVNSGQASGSIPLAVGSTAVSIVVTAEDNWTQKTYRLTVTRSDLVIRNSDANLTSLNITGLTLDSSFSANDTNYVSNVANDVSSFTLTPGGVGSGATITVNGTSVSAGSSINVPLSVGSNIVTVLVTAEDGFTQKNYTLEVVRTARTEAALANLVLSEAGISPAFSSGVYSYTLTVAEAVGSLGVTPALVDSAASININGTTSSSGSTHNVSLSPGSNQINVVVTAQDGVTTKIYQLNVTRTSSINVDLAGLTISAGAMDQSFASGTTAYTKTVASADSSVTVTPTVADGASTVKVNGVIVNSGSASGSIALTEGANVISVVVTGSDAVTTKTYSITVTRPSALSNNANLSVMSISSGTLSPVFASSSTSYTAAVPNTSSTLTVTPTLADSKASVLVNGASAATAVNLAVGSNTINVVVTAENGTTTKTYTLTVTRQASTITNLSALTISTGPLTPTFSSATTSYSQTVAYGIDSLTVTPTVENSESTVKVNTVSVISGFASAPISLNTGVNAINVTVTAGDGTSTKNYVINVTRQGNSDANLTNLVFSSGALTPVFASGTTSYTQSVPYATSQLTVTPTLSDIHASSLKVNTADVASGSASGNINLNVGANVINTVVVAENGSTSKTYAVTVTRAVASTDANLSALTLSNGTLSPVFAAGTTSYTATVINSVSSLTVTATANNANYSSLTIASSAATSGVASGAISLAVGSNPINVVLTAEDGVTQKTYQVVVTRQSPASSNADLSGLVPASGALDQSFQASSTSYTMTVPNLVSTMQVTPTLADSTATIKVNNQTVANGALSQAIALTAGSATNINVVVTAQDTVTTKTYTIAVTRELASAFAQTAYVKASNTGAGDKFGYSLDISGDWMVVSALNEDGSVTSDGGSFDNNALADAGGVYVFKRTAGSWAQQAYLKPESMVINPTWNALESGDGFGWSVAMDGDTIVVGTPGNDSGVTGVHYPSDGQSYEDAVAGNGVSNAGAVFVFRDSSGTGAGTWALEAVLKPHALNANLGFGRSIAISGDTVVVGAIGDDTSGTDSGAAWVFKRTGTTWAQQAYLKASNPTGGDWYGMSVAIDGDTAVVTAPYEDTGATNAGAAYVYVRSGSTWTEQAMLKEATPYAENRMGGGNLSCSCDYIYEMVDISGDTIAVTVSLDNTAGSGAGAVAVFVRSGTTWTQQALLIATEVTVNQLASGVGLDGDTLVFGAAQADGNNTGINSTANTSIADSGAAWVFTRSGTTWTQQYYIKPSNPTAVDNFGVRCDVNQGTVACSASLEDGSATVINGVDDNAASAAGALYIFN